MLKKSLPRRGDTSLWVERYGLEVLSRSTIVRFLLRCIFFLSIVYAAILRQDALPELSTPVARALPDVEASAARRLVDGVATVCGRDPRACLDGAAKLSRLLAPTADASQRQVRMPF